MNFNIFQKSLKCDWCGKVSEVLSYSKAHNGSEYHFCSKSCKQFFRAKRCSGSKGCPSCFLKK